MAKPQNRLQLMKRVGAIQANTVWSWCAVNHDERKAYFSVWTDHVGQVGKITTYTLQEPHWAIDEAGRKSAARNDHDEKLALVFDQGYEAYAYFVEAKDRRALPREIADTRTTFVMQMRLTKEPDGRVTGVPVRRVEIG
jgi:hypothetical protein